MSRAAGQQGSRVSRVSRAAGQQVSRVSRVSRAGPRALMGQWVDDRWQVVDLRAKGRLIKVTSSEMPT